jgi:hypothetical protein
MSVILPRGANRTVLRLRPYILRVPTAHFGMNPYRIDQQNSADGTGYFTVYTAVLRVKYMNKSHESM